MICWVMFRGPADIDCCCLKFRATLKNLRQQLIFSGSQPPEVALLLGETGYRHDTDVNPWENCIAPDIASIFI